MLGADLMNRLDGAGVETVGVERPVQAAKGGAAGPRRGLGEDDPSLALSLCGPRLPGARVGLTEVRQVWSEAVITDDKGRELLRSGTLEWPVQFNYDFTDCPDLVQTCAVTLCALGIPFRFTGTTTLRVKETDRMEALRVELTKLGAEVLIVGDVRKGDMDQTAAAYRELFKAAGGGGLGRSLLDTIAAIDGVHAAKQPRQGDHREDREAGEGLAERFSVG